jgi:hypothetical protein
MAFSLVEFTHILSTIEDILFMGENQSPINISTGAEDDEYNKIFIQFAFHLKQGKSEIRIYDTNGIISYLGVDGENLRKLEFDQASISATYSSFNKALKQILDLDRQRVNKTKGTNNSEPTTETIDVNIELVNSSLDEIRKNIPEVS